MDPLLASRQNSNLIKSAGQDHPLNLLFYVLQETTEQTNLFADDGDSGAAVVTDEGVLVGVVLANWRIGDVQMIIDPVSGKLDPTSFRAAREEDGSLDWEKYVTTLFHGNRFVIVSPVEMVLERARYRKEEGDMILVRDI